MTHCSDGRTSASSNFHIRLRASGLRGRSVRTAELQHTISISDVRASGPLGTDVGTVEGESAVSIYDAQASGPRLTNIRTVNFELRFLPYWDTRPNSRLIFHFLELGKNQRTVRELIGIRTCCWNVRTDASWNRIFSIQCRGPDGRNMSSGRDDTSSGRLNLMPAISIYKTRTSGRLIVGCMTCFMKDIVRTRSHIVRTIAAVFP